MFAEDSKGINIKIMGKQHQFTCPNEDVEDLKQAAKTLAQMCEDIKENTGIVSSERALLVASLNLSHSLLIANNKLKHCHDEQSALVTKLKKAL